MTIYIDGDACPVKSFIIDQASKQSIKVIIVISICHISTKNKNNAEYMVVDNVNQSVDMMIINRARKNDIVITDDYGLASILLMKKVFCLSNRGLIYTLENIDHLLFKKHINAKVMKGGGKIKGNSKRNKEDDAQFAKSLDKVMKQSLYSPHA
ncbi:YaiI/YqxD family protein [Clostridiaceae bacterium 35-E11]